jgi:hypothetical protein
MLAVRDLDIATLGVEAPTMEWALDRISDSAAVLELLGLWSFWDFV